ncbi:MAG: TonB-dependent receptor [Saprospiraceae bacterium]|nr:TonB-dependent receptor [Saprospiraceae bacterium]
MTKLLTLLLLSSLTTIAYAQFSTVSGTIKDQASGEQLIGASVHWLNDSTGTTTNEYGFYSLRVSSQDSVHLQISYIGYTTLEVSILAGKDVALDLHLIPDEINLDEVLVTSDSYRERLRSTEMSVEGISTREAKILPALLGEVDIIKTIQLKPGISSGSEGSSGLYVRGGGADQNLIILDEAIVYNANHLFGFFSTFSADAIKDVKVYKGGFPSQYGGRLSSVIDVKLKEGNNQRFSGTGGLGLISSRLTLEGPITKDKSSFIVSGRRTYVDLITNAVNRSNVDKESFNPIPAYSFYDLNAKVNFKLGERDHLYLSGYFGRDLFAFSDDNFDFDFNWGNGTGTVRWNHQFNPRLFSNTTFTYSQYHYRISNRVTGFSFNLSSQIRDVNFKTDLYYAVNNNHTLRMGLQATSHRFDVGRLKAGSDDGTVSFSAGQKFDGTEFGLYVSDEAVISQELKVTSGLRLSAFSNKGETYFSLEPRVAARLLVSDRTAVKLSYARMKQYVHLVSNSGLALPTDIWYPSTRNVKPEVADQIAVGYSYLLGKHFLLTNEYYYKFLDHQIEFKDHANLFANDDLEQEFRFGDGFAYGMELGLEKKAGRFTGWLGYTLAYIRKGGFEDIQDGDYFPPSHDRRHDLSMVAMFQLNRRFTVTSTFVYGSGDIGWLPLGRYIFQDVPGAEFQAVVPVYGDRNSFRLPPYHRMDLGLVINFFPNWGHQDLTISIYNLYDRRNPYFLFLDADTETLRQGNIDIEVPTGIAAKQVSLFPILPSVTWNFKF